jgi:hypothetical protein
MFPASASPIVHKLVLLSSWELNLNLNLNWCSSNQSCDSFFTCQWYCQNANASGWPHNLVSAGTTTWKALTWILRWNWIPSSLVQVRSTACESPHSFHHLVSTSSTTSETWSALHIQKWIWSWFMIPSGIWYQFKLEWTRCSSCYMAAHPKAIHF